MNRIFRIVLILAMAISTTLLGSCDGGGSSSAQTRDGAPVKLDAVALFAVGRIRQGKTNVGNASIVRSDTEVFVGGRSLLDLQLRTGAVATVRLAAGTRFSFSARRYGKRTEVTLRVARGRALFNVEKLAKNEDLIVVTPTSRAVVRGTKFATSVSRDGSSTTKVYEGSVAARLRIPKVEDLPTGVVDQSKALRSIVATSEKSTKTVSAGSSFSTTRKQVRAVSKSVAGMDKLLSSGPLRANLKGQRTKGKDKSAAGLIDGFFNKTGSKASIDAALKKNLAKSKISLATLKKSDTKKALQEYREIVAVDQQKIRDEKAVRSIVARRIRKQNKRLVVRIQRVFRKRMETLMLRGGGRIRGVIEQVGSDFYVHTPSGRRFLPSSKVSGFAF